MHHPIPLILQCHHRNLHFNTNTRLLTKPLSFYTREILTQLSTLLINKIHQTTPEPGTIGTQGQCYAATHLLH